MSLYVNTTLVGAIAFIMIFTYTAELMFFSDSSDIDSSKGQIASSNLPISKRDWINIQWDFAYDKEYGLNVYNEKYGNLPKIKISDIPDQMRDDCFHHSVLLIGNCESLLIVYPYPDYGYNVYSKGYDDGDKFHMSAHLYYEIDAKYFNYCYQLGYTPEGNLIEKNLIDSAISFLSSIPDGINKFFSVVTFDIKSEYNKIDSNGNIVVGEREIIPSAVRIILNIFFIPMWIVLTIEIVPVLAKIIEAIGSLIPF